MSEIKNLMEIGKVSYDKVEKSFLEFENHKLNEQVKSLKVDTQKILAMQKLIRDVIENKPMSIEKCREYIENVDKGDS